MDPEQRKRTDLYKGIIVAFALISILAPLTVCIALFGQVKQLKEDVESLTALQGYYAARLNALGECEAEALAELRKPSGQQETGTDSENGAQKQTQEGINKTQSPFEHTGGENAVQEETPSDENTPESAGLSDSVTEKDTRKKVYLTFDDGPSTHTGEILDILKEYDAKATFFVNGRSSELYGDAYKRIVDEGHTLAMHSYTHVYAEVYASVDAFMDDMYTLRDYLHELTGVWSGVYRFPGGSSNTITKINIREFGKALAEENIVYFDWNVSSGDGGNKPPGAEEIYKSVTDGILKKSEPVVLMHDLASKKTTVEALPLILQFIEENDCVAVGIDETTKPVQHRKLEN